MSKHTDTPTPLPTIVQTVRILPGTLHHLTIPLNHFRVTLTDMLASYNAATLPYLDTLYSIHDLSQESNLKVALVSLYTIIQKKNSQYYLVTYIIYCMYTYCAQIPVYGHTMQYACVYIYIYIYNICD